MHWSIQMFETVCETKGHISNNYYVPLPAGSFKVITKTTQSTAHAHARTCMQKHTHTQNHGKWQ
jgi:hypothetical protein